MSRAVTLEKMVVAWGAAEACDRRRALAMLEGAEAAPIIGASEETPMLLNAAAAARLASVSKPTIFRWSRLGILRPVQIAGQKRWVRADLERLSAEGGAAGPSTVKNATSPEAQAVNLRGRTP